MMFSVMIFITCSEHLKMILNHSKTRIDECFSPKQIREMSFRNRSYTSPENILSPRKDRRGRITYSFPVSRKRWSRRVDSRVINNIKRDLFGASKCYKITTEKDLARRNQDVMTGKHKLENLVKSEKSSVIKSNTTASLARPKSDTDLKPVNKSNNESMIYDDTETFETLHDDFDLSASLSLDDDSQRWKKTRSRMLNFVRQLTKKFKRKPKEKEVFPPYKFDANAMTNADPISQAALTLEHLVVQTPYGFSTLKSRPMTMCTESMFH